ncbi:MAG: hypothetical protein HOY71_37250 [Nonomuraea sp.]|nr:hypothetical protein [Nonomuraea sp.]
MKKTPGISKVILGQKGSVQVGYGSERAEILAVDLNEWRKISPVELPSFPAGSGIPALVSPELRGRGTFEIGWQSRLKVNTVGVITSLPGFFTPTSGRFMVVPYDVNERPSPNTLLMDGDATLTGLLPGMRVETQAGVLAGIRDDPLTATVRNVLFITMIALAGYALVAVVVTLVVGAAERARALSFLRTLGLSVRQSQALTVLEISPMIVVTALVGLALGLGLPAALGPGVDLSAYAGDTPVGDYSPGLALPIGLAAALTAVALVGAYTHTAISRRRSLGSVLRVGEVL